MATQIHGFGPNGELSPGAEAALNGLGPGGGSTLVQVSTLTLPEDPDEGESVSVLADSTTVIPAGVTWDSGGEPTITERMLLVFVWSGTDWVGTYGLSIPEPPDTTAPTVPTGLTATATSHTTVDLEWVASTDDVGVTGYEYRVDGGAAVDAGAGTTETVDGLTAGTEYDFEVRAYDEAGNRSDWSTPATETTDAAPSDSTPPTPGTLSSSSITDTSFTLTVTGAADETALHAQPYAFSTDNGSTWSAWQAAAAYNASGLTAETTYTCQHKVRDAALNEATGTAITVETTVASSGTVLASDTFDRADDPTGLGVADTGQTWVKNSSNGMGIIDGKAYALGTNAHYYVTATGASGDVTVEADVTYGTSAGLLLRRTSGTGFYRLTFSASSLVLYRGTTTQASYAFTGTNGDVHHIKAVIVDDDITVYLDDVVVLTHPDLDYSTSESHGVFCSTGSGRIDNFVISSNA